MKKLFSIWLVVLLLLTGFGVWATYSNYLIDDADDFNFSLGKPAKGLRRLLPKKGGGGWGDDDFNPSLREDSTRGTTRGFFPLYFSGRGPRGGGFGYGK